MSGQDPSRLALHHMLARRALLFLIAPCPPPSLARACVMHLLLLLLLLQACGLVVFEAWQGHILRGSACCVLLTPLGPTTAATRHAGNAADSPPGAPAAAAGDAERAMRCMVEEFAAAEAEAGSSPGSVALLLHDLGLFLAYAEAAAADSFSRSFQHQPLRSRLLVHEAHLRAGYRLLDAAVEGGHAVLAAALQAQLVALSAAPRDVLLGGAQRPAGLPLLHLALLSGNAEVARLVAGWCAAAPGGEDWAKDALVRVVVPAAASATAGTAGDDGPSSVPLRTACVSVSPMQLAEALGVADLVGALRRSKSTDAAAAAAGDGSGCSTGSSTGSSPRCQRDRRSSSVLLAAGGGACS